MQPKKYYPSNREQFEQYLIALIRDQQWKYATTYDKTAPHEYILMEWSEDLFRAIGDYIERYGEDTFFYKSPVRYGYIGNYRYWHYNTYVHDSVMNRALNNDYSDEVRAKYMKEKFIIGEA